MMRTQEIQWKPFSNKHKQYIKSAPSNQMCVAEGAIRSGKTIDHCVVAAQYLETCPDKIHLASGSTIPNAKLNIGACNGFGLENLFRGRCRWGKYKDNEALYIQTQTGEKIVLFAGGGKADSYKKILGNSYGLWIATEINEHYDCDDSRKSFIKVAFGRQAAAQKPFTLWDLNPSNPNHPVYKNYIDKYMSGFPGGYLYQRFVLADNLSVSEERRKAIEAQYDPDSLWYKRDILGLRVIAEGVIYRKFADNPDDFLVDADKYLAEHRPAAIFFGVDWGNNKSANASISVAVMQGYEEIVIFDEFYSKEEYDPEQIYGEHLKTIEKVVQKYGGMRCFADEPLMLVKGLARSVARKSLRCQVSRPFKYEIKDRIVLVCSLLAQGRLKIDRNCVHIQDALKTAVWDSRADKDTRLDDGTSNIDSLDAFEYAICSIMKQLNLASGPEKQIKGSF